MSRVLDTCVVPPMNYVFTYPSTSKINYATSVIFAETQLYEHGFAHYLTPAMERVGPVFRAA
eukprot:5750927-Pleurochrysis_carterae.AAC.1